MSHALEDQHLSHKTKTAGIHDHFGRNTISFVFPTCQLHTQANETIFFACFGFKCLSLVSTSDSLTRLEGSLGTHKTLQKSHTLRRREDVRLPSRQEGPAGQAFLKRRASSAGPLEPTQTKVSGRAVGPAQNLERSYPLPTLSTTPNLPWPRQVCGLGRSQLWPGSTPRGGAASVGPQPPAPAPKGRKFLALAVLSLHNTGSLRQTRL